MTITPEAIAAICDHTFLKPPEAYVGKGSNPISLREADFFAFLEEVCTRSFRPYAVCVRAVDVPHAATFLETHGHGEIPLVATVGFPEGGWYEKKYTAFEADYALSRGAKEIDMVLNYPALKAGDFDTVVSEMESIRKVVDLYSGVLKVIVETSELDTQAIITACELAQQVGVDFVKTSTGFASKGAEESKLAIMSTHFPGGIKISGGVTAENVCHFLSVVANVRPGFTLNPQQVRVGASQLLSQLEQ